jgi:hypothetical protein
VAGSSAPTPVPKNASIPAVRNELAGPGGVVPGRH